MKVPLREIYHKGMDELPNFRLFTKLVPLVLARLVPLVLAKLEPLVLAKLEPLVLLRLEPRNVLKLEPLVLAFTARWWSISICAQGGGITRDTDSAG